MSKETHNSNEIQLLDALVVLAKHKVMVIALVFSITALSVVISLILPQTFKSSSIIMPPVQQQSMGGLAGLMGSPFQLNLGSSPQVSPEVLLSILNSRSLRVEIVDHFDLYEAYGTDILESILMSLNEAIHISENREGGFGFNPIISLQISVTDQDPVRAQEMTQFIVTRLNERVLDVNRGNAVEQFSQIERRFKRNLVELEAAELALKEFQEEHGIIEIGEQSRALIETVSLIKGQIVETEITVNVLRQTVSATNPELIRQQRTLAELESQYNALVNRGERQRSGAIPSLGNVPELALEYYRLFREVTVQGRVYETLFPQYDFQKLSLESSRRGIQILDEAHLPTYKDGPKRAFIVLAGMVFSIFLSFILVFYRHTMETGKADNNIRYQKVIELQKQLGLRRD